LWPQIYCFARKRQLFQEPNWARNDRKKMGGVIRSNSRLEDHRASCWILGSAGGFRTVKLFHWIWTRWIFGRFSRMFIGPKVSQVGCWIFRFF